MAENTNRYTNVIWQLFEELLEEENIESALAGSLEILVRALKCEGGVLWLLDQGSEVLVPMFHVGSMDLSNFSASLGTDVESYVTRSGEALQLSKLSDDDRFDGTLLEDHGMAVRNMICVPLNDLEKNVGCLQLVNRRDGDFREDDLKLCMRLAALTALTIQEKGLAVTAGEKKDILIRLRGVTKEFQNGDTLTKVLKGIDLDIYKGEFLVILGESGCGKSTLVNIIGGMDYLTDGSLMIEGKDFSHPSEHDLTEFRREYMGFVFQNYNLMPNLTAQENVQFIADIAQEPMDSKEAIDKVGLSDRANNYPSALSGGQQQRVSIARAIVKNPKIIFADEPTAALDYQTSIEVLSVFEEIVKSRGTTVVMITHNPEIAKMANRIVKLKGGLVSSIKINLQPVHADELVW